MDPMRDQVADHEQRIKRLEKALAAKLEADDIEKMIEEKYSQTAPTKGKK